MSDAIHFDHPPLDEVVCGVHFAGVKWSDIHFGLFYTEVRRHYPHFQRRPPIALFESRGSEGLQIELMTEPQLPLLWYESPDSPFLLQVQKDAFFVNWHRQSGTFIYPHFHTREGGEQGVWDRSVTEWETFRTFWEKQAIGTPEVLACHLAYINHMVHEETWDVPADLARWFRLLAGVKGTSPVDTLNLLIRSGHPECELFLPVIARLHGVSTQQRLEILVHAASHPSPDVHYNLLQALRTFSLHEAEPLLKTLSRDQDTEIADEARTRLESLKAES